MSGLLDLVGKESNETVQCIIKYHECNLENRQFILTLRLKAEGNNSFCTLVFLQCPPPISSIYVTLS